MLVHVWFITAFASSLWPLASCLDCCLASLLLVLCKTHKLEYMPVPFFCCCCCRSCFLLLCFVVVAFVACVCFRCWCYCLCYCYSKRLAQPRRAKDLRGCFVYYVSMQRMSRVLCKCRVTFVLNAFAWSGEQPANARFVWGAHHFANKSLLFEWSGRPEQ